MLDFKLMSYRRVRLARLGRQVLRPRGQPPARVASYLIKNLCIIHIF